MDLISFIIYFNKETGKIEAISDNFAREISGKTKVFHLGHYYLRNKLKEKKLDEMIVGVYSQDENGKAFMENVRYQRGTFVDVNKLTQFAIHNHTSIMEERQYMSDVIIDFVRGVVSEDHFKQFIRMRILNSNINVPDIYNQKTR